MFLFLRKISGLLPSHAIAKNILRMFKAAFKSRFHTMRQRTHSHTMNLMTMPLLIPLAHRSLHFVVVTPAAYLTRTVLVNAHYSFGITECYHHIFIFLQ